MQIFLATHSIPKMNMVWVASINVSGDDIVDWDIAASQELLEYSGFAISIRVGKKQPYTTTD